MDQSITYFPKDGVLYSGSFDDIDSVDFSAQYLASLERKAPDWSAALDTSKPNNVEYEFTDVSERVASVKKLALKAAHLTKIAKHNYSANVNNELAQIERSAELNDSAIQQITIVQFIQSILGQLENVNVISKAFTNLPLNSLRGKVPEGGSPNISIQVDRLSEPRIDHTDFGQTEFRIKRNDVHLYISREDRMEATVDPLAFSTAQGQRQMMQARDLMALKELSNITLGTQIKDPTEGLATLSVPRAKNDVVGEFLGKWNKHFTTYRNRLKYFIMNNEDYRALQTNYYTRNNLKVAPAKGFGMVPFVGLEEYGITAILSPWVPRTVVYSLTGEGAYELDGPKIVDTEYDARKFADYTPMRDFIGYKLVNPKRFAEKFVMPIADVSKGTEITTDGQIETLLVGPEPDKNASA